MRSRFMRPWIWVALIVLTENTIPRATLAQAPPAELGHKETKDDQPAKRPSDEAQSAPQRADVFRRYRSVQVNVDAQGNNIPGDAANEPSFAIDPTRPDRIAVGWRQFDSVLSNFRQAGYAYSVDGGVTWTFPGSLESGIFRSDPVLDYDADGRFYYNSLQSDFTCQYFVSNTAGATWGAARPAYGGDKLWSAVDRTSGVGRGNIYCAWSPAAGCCGNRLFTRSTNRANIFMNPIALPGSPFWGTLTVAANGNLFISGRTTNGLAPVLRSTNAQNPSVTPAFTSLGPVALGGETQFSMGPNPQGLLGQVWIACEPEGGPRPDNVYMLASVDPPGPDPLDVMFARSTDGGVTWDPPIRINDDFANSNAWQWFGTMSVGPDGRIDAVWNDTRNDPTGETSELFFSSSEDGGVTWSASIAVSPPFDHSLGYPNQAKLGDYYQMISEEHFANVIYAATFNGEQDVYFLRIPVDCNENGIEDALDVSAGTSLDCNNNGIPDSCDRDCDNSGYVDECELAAGSAPDCDGSGSSDICDIAFGDTPDCDGRGVPDTCELAAGTALDCNANAIPDECDILSGAVADCDVNGVPDSCDGIALAATIVKPQSTSACVDDIAQMSVSAPGATGFQWRFEGVDIPNTNNATLTIDPVTLADEGLYTCVVSFGCLSAESKSAALHVIPQSIEIELLSPAVLPLCATGGSNVAVLIVDVDDVDGIQYQWSRNGVDLVNGGRILGADTDTLEITSPILSDDGVYTCRAWNTCMDEQDAVATNGVIQVVNAIITSQPQPACAELGSAATFTAHATSPINFVPVWYEGNTQLNNGGRYSGTRTDTLQISNIQASDLGRKFHMRALVIDPFCSTISDEAPLWVQQVGACTACPQPGDFDADGDYDLIDMQRFTSCIDMDVNAMPACACANVDGTDTTVDISDWLLLEQVLSGPEVP